MKNRPAPTQGSPGVGIGTSHSLELHIDTESGRWGKSEVGRNHPNHRTIEARPIRTSEFLIRWNRTVAHGPLLLKIIFAATGSPREFHHQPAVDQRDGPVPLPLVDTPAGRSTSCAGSWMQAPGCRRFFAATTISVHTPEMRCGSAGFISAVHPGLALPGRTASASPVAIPLSFRRIFRRLPLPRAS